MVAIQYDYGINEPRMQDAIAELKALVLSQYPDATFEVFPSSNVNGVYMRIIVDIDEPGDVSDLIQDRMVAMQLDEELPIYPIPVRPRRWSVVELDAQNAIIEATPEPPGSQDVPR